jgi:hypothetical protein
VGVTTADFVSKSTKPVVLANGDAIVVYKVGDKYYCSDANSTAFRYPMVDAKVVVDKNGEPVAEVPFDGTVYSEPPPIPDSLLTVDDQSIFSLRLIYLIHDKCTL